MVTPSDSSPGAVWTGTPISTTPTIDPAVSALLDDLKQDVELVKAIVVGAKNKGAAGAVETAIGAVPMITKEVGDVKAALPVLKAGFATSEGQLALGYAVVSEAIAYFAPHLPDWALPLNSVIVGLVITAYGYFRARTKTAHVTAVATVTAAQSAAVAKAN